jgi:tRNA(fMet)-specific endonuclease VapC
MLDTNTVSYLLRGNELVKKAVLSCRMSDLCISSITEAELLYGIMRRPEATKIEKTIRELLGLIESLPCGAQEALHFAVARSAVEKNGKTLESMDMLIAAHALSVGAVLVTNDKVFSYVDGLQLENWVA